MEVIKQDNYVVELNKEEMTEVMSWAHMARNRAEELRRDLSDMDEMFHDHILEQYEENMEKIRVIECKFIMA